MQDDDPIEDFDEPPRRLEVNPNDLRNALYGLELFGDDPYLRMQGLNLSIVDSFTTELENRIRSRMVEDEGSQIEDLAFLLAQSQMWIFAAYELLRTWRQRAKDMIKWHDNGGLQHKLESLTKEVGFVHFGKEVRAEQIRRVLTQPDIIQRIRDDLARTHILFSRLEFLRVSLAKHEVSGKKNSVALMPGYGRINRETGSLDFSLDLGRDTLGYLSRRDVADEIRLFAAAPVPTQEDIAQFDKYLKGPIESES